MTYSSTSSSCSNVVSGIRIQILYARVGAANNPQFKITYAGVKFITSTWQVRDQINSGVAQNYPVTTYVTFRELDSAGAKTINKVLPQVVPNLNTDVLYPFTSG